MNTPVIKLTNARNRRESLAALTPEYLERLEVSDTKGALDELRSRGFVVEVVDTWEGVLNHVDRLVPPKYFRVAVVVWHEDEDYEGNRVAPSQKVFKIKREEAVGRVAAAYLEAGSLPQTLKEAEGLLRESLDGGGEWCSARVMTCKEYKARRRAREKAEVEELAAHVAGKYKVRPGTLDFVRAVRKHYARIVRGEQHYRNDPESRMERYACYDSKENFFLDNDYSTSQEMEARDKARKLLKYCERYFPLTMLEARERRRKKG